MHCSGMNWLYTCHLLHICGLALEECPNINRIFFARTTDDNGSYNVCIHCIQCFIL